MHNGSDLELSYAYIILKFSIKNINIQTSDEATDVHAVQKLYENYTMSLTQWVVSQLCIIWTWEKALFFCDINYSLFICPFNIFSRFYVRWSWQQTIAERQVFVFKGGGLDAT